MQCLLVQQKGQCLHLLGENAVCVCNVLTFFKGCT